MKSLPAHPDVIKIMGDTFQIIINSPTANRSVYVIGAAGFCALIHQISTTKTSWCFIGPASRLKPPGKNQPAAPAPAGDSLLVSRFLPTREQTKQYHKPASHHECKNTRHRDSAPTPHTAERYAKCYVNSQNQT